MFGRKKNKEEHRYYLLPGMGKANRRKHQLYLKVGIAVGLIASALIATLMILLTRRGL